MWNFLKNVSDLISREQKISSNSKLGKITPLGKSESESNFKGAAD